MKIFIGILLVISLLVSVNAELTINGITIPDDSSGTSEFDANLLDLENIFQEIRKVDVLYVHANGQRIAKIEESDGQRELLFFHNDHLGSPRAISNVQGNIIEKIDYLPFGATLSPQTEKIQYNSKELDFDTGLLYYGARYYDARLGRFITADTVSGNVKEPQSLNKYVYTKNNPLKFIDPTGNAAKKINVIKVQFAGKEVEFSTPDEIPDNLFIATEAGGQRTTFDQDKHTSGKLVLIDRFTSDKSREIVRTFGRSVNEEGKVSTFSLGSTVRKRTSRELGEARITGQTGGINKAGFKLGRVEGKEVKPSLFEGFGKGLSDLFKGPSLAEKGGANLKKITGQS